MPWLRSSKTLDAFDRLTAAEEVVDTDRPRAGYITSGGNLITDELWMSSEVAQQVPAYHRARVLMTGQLSQLPLRQYRRMTGERLPSIPFLRRPDPGRVPSALWSDLIGDLADHGVAYALNPLWDRADGWRDGTKHKLVKYLPVVDVLDVTVDSYVIQYGRPGADTYREEVVPARAVIAFECPSGQWLKHGARALTTGRMLEEAVRLYASNPAPSTLLRNTGPRKTPEQVQELLDTLEASRKTRATTYLGRDLELEHFGFDANAIALSESRSSNVLEIARLTGVPSIYLSQGPSEASMTYSNQTQARLDLHAAMTPFATAIAERLSMDDVSSEGVRVEYDFSEWLRVDPMMRAELYTKLVPLGVLTVEEARRLENLNATEGQTG